MGYLGVLYVLAAIEKAYLPSEIFKNSKYGRASYLIKAKSEKDRIEQKF